MIPLARLDAEEAAGEVVQTLGATGALADELVGLNPDQVAVGLTVEPPRPA